MSITDELREWTNGFVLAIADRIDAEYEEAIQQALMGEGGVPATDENMAELGWVRLPLDADNVPIHIGDVMAYADNTKPMEVVALVPPAVFLTEDGPRYADMCRHHHAPTVEDVLREFFARYVTTKPKEEDDAIIAEYAAKLRLAEVEDA